MHDIISRTDLKDSHFVHLISAIGYMLRILVAVEKVFKPPASMSLSVSFVLSFVYFVTFDFFKSIPHPDFLKDLPTLVKSVGRSLLPELSQKDTMCTASSTSLYRYHSSEIINTFV